MSAVRVFRLIACFFAAMLVVIIAAANLGLAPELFGPVYAFPYGDTIGHFILLGLFSMLISLGFTTSRARILGIPLLKGGLVLAALITVEEFSQIFLKNRSFSLLDLFANYAGIFLLGEFGAWAREKMEPRSAVRKG